MYDQNIVYRDYISDVTHCIPLGVQNNAVPIDCHRRSRFPAQIRTSNSRCMFGIWTRNERTPEENCTKASHIYEAEAHGNVQHAKFLRSIRGPSSVLNEPPYVKMSDFRWNTQRFYNHNHPDLSLTVHYQHLDPLDDHFRLRPENFDGIFHIQMMRFIEVWSVFNLTDLFGTINIDHWHDEHVQGTSDLFMRCLIQLASE